MSRIRWGRGSARRAVGVALKRSSVLGCLSLLLSCLSATAATGASVETVKSVESADSADAVAFARSVDVVEDPFFGTETVEFLGGADVGSELELPFGTDENVERATRDFDLKSDDGGPVDCSGFDRFAVDVDVAGDWAAFGSSTIYLRSAKGWYSLGGRALRSPKKGRLTLVADLKDARVEGKPDGYDRIDGVRVAFWRGGSANARVSFRSLRASSVSFAALDVDDGNAAENGPIFASFGRLAGACGVATAPVAASELGSDGSRLRRYSVVFVPATAGMRAETVDALCEYVDGGGFVVACYVAPEKLLRKLGFRPGKYVRAQTGAMTLDANARRDAAERGFELPERVAQRSWNFISATPDPNWKAARESAIFGGFGARTLAVWVDESGKSTDEAALLASPVGLYCAHILLGEDVPGTAAILRAVASAADANVDRRFAAAQWAATVNVGVDPTETSEETAARERETFAFVRDAAAKRGWTLEEIAETLGGAGDAGKLDESGETRTALKKLAADLAAIRAERAAQFCADFGNDVPGKPNERRLWWEHSGCGAYPGDWERTARELKDAGFTGVIPNMLWGGAAYYKSDVLPIDPKVEKYGDQIEQCVAAAKKYGLETHIWKVCFNASNSPKSFLDAMRAEGRLQRSFDGEEELWLCPSNPANRALELAALTEVATKYDVDGIHFDYIRFPDGEHCFCDGCKERFGAFYRERTGKELTDFPKVVRADKEGAALFAEWRCAQIDALVRETSETVRAKRPDILISAAVFSGWPGTKRSIGQDWGRWVEKGWVDFVCPMDYTSDPGAFAGFVAAQRAHTDGKAPLYPGIGATATGLALNPEEVATQIRIARKLGADGFTIFNLSRGTAETILPALKPGLMRSGALDSNPRD